MKFVFKLQFLGFPSKSKNLDFHWKNSRTLRNSLIYFECCYTIP
ncbi:hypothetical protein LEP1GSC125_0860 [Leptospira mayottensis 200901122]|uniref:Uncharacterized protein n=1 Tax=Leptospira mayottensis 200901122 TaxID=1193010 RepID=A0AA87SZ38_9LEPT|nr:hypothetical protein LEP1GSC125_0860 [Leptospira mayottensis 200901122]